MGKWETWSFLLVPARKTLLAQEGNPEEGHHGAANLLPLLLPLYPGLPFSFRGPYQLFSPLLSFPKGCPCASALPLSSSHTLSIHMEEAQAGGFGSIRKGPDSCLAGFPPHPGPTRSRIATLTTAQSASLPLTAPLHPDPDSQAACWSLPFSSLAVHPNSTGLKQGSLLVPSYRFSSFCQPSKLSHL